MAKYALKGLVRGHHVMTEVAFEADSDEHAWGEADQLVLPEGFITCQLVEKVKRSERNVPPSRAAFANMFASLGL